MEESPVSHTLG